MTPELVVFSGLQVSGKTSFYRAVRGHARARQQRRVAERFDERFEVALDR